MEFVIMAGDFVEGKGVGRGGRENSACVPYGR